MFQDSWTQGGCQYQSYSIGSVSLCIMALNASYCLMQELGLGLRVHDVICIQVGVSRNNLSRMPEVDPVTGQTLSRCCNKRQKRLKGLSLDLRTKMEHQGLG